MYSKIMVPVDLAHTERLGKALTTAADLARHYGIPVCFAGVTGEAPSEVAHNPAEYAERLAQFAEGQAVEHGVKTEAVARIGHDPAVELANVLIQAAADTGCDLVIMASHVPGFPDHLFASNAGTVASHAPVSVFVVR